MTVKLYTVTVETTYVFASESDDTACVKREFRRELRTNLCMQDELDQGDVSVTPLEGLPGGYDRNALPWGGRGDATIGELIDAGAAPRYTELRAELSAAAKAAKEGA